MKIQSRREKGKWFEKTVGDLLGIWWQGVPFPKAPGSGAGSVNTKGDVYQAGDLLVCKDFPFSVECKCQQEWSLNRLFDQKATEFVRWWIQCRDDAIRVEREPLLVVKKNHSGALAVFRYDSLLGKHVKSELISFFPSAFFHLDGYGHLVAIPLESIKKIDKKIFFSVETTSCSL